MKTHSVTLGGCLTALVLASVLPAYSQEQQDILLDEGTILDMLVVQAASDELRQALGVSNITSEDLLNRPVARDISEIVRTMPGVNLSGNTSTGQRGNQRQIDLRGMGPENTLILIDGRPVLSRNAVRPGRRGERDTRGDAGWIPPELIERIEVIRGPAAARYGSGAAGGVVNIITRQPEQLTMQVSTFLQIPEDSDEGGSRRVNALLAGPVNDMLSYRLTAGASWTDPDSPDINEEAAEDEDAPAGREGVVTYDFSALWSAQLDANHSVDLDVSWSRQSNIFAGDTLLSSPTDLTDALAEDGAETNTMERTSVALTHSGTYDFGVSESFIQWENTFNRRLSEGTAGGGEGAINTEEDYRVGILDNIIAKTEWDIPLFVLRDQTITLGAEYRGEFLESYTELADGTIEDFEGRYQEAHMLGLYVEDNILVTDQLTVTPGLRLDVHDSFGANYSPSLNVSYALTDEITVKAGIARAFKAPTVYQLNPLYAWSTRGRGCPTGFSGPCDVFGNPDLEPEHSLNMEVGVAYANVDGWQASLTYFHNEFDNRIEAVYVDDPSYPGSLFRWGNSGSATVRGLEGNLVVPLHETVSWSTNFTAMLESREHEYDQPLSLIPDYTINSSLRWEAMENLGLTLSGTYYGEIQPRTVDHNNDPIPEEEQIGRDPYGVVNFALDYQINDNARLTAGVNNLFHTQLYRTGEGANTFNEPGRSFYVGLTGSF